MINPPLARNQEEVIGRLPGAASNFAGAGPNYLKGQIKKGQICLERKGRIHTNIGLSPS